MANPNKPSGFSPVKYLNGASWDGKVQIYFIDSSDTNSFTIGDPVKLTGTGDTVRGIPAITRATAGATFVGVFMGAGVFAGGGAYVNPSNLDSIIVPGTKLKSYYAAVIDDPNVIFEAQEANNGTAIAVTNIGENIDFLAANPGTGVVVSGFTLDDTAHDTTSTRNFKLLRLAPRSDNALGSSAKWWVLPNNHSFRAGITGI